MIVHASGNIAPKLACCFVKAQDLQKYITLRENTVRIKYASAFPEAHFYRTIYCFELCAMEGCRLIATLLCLISVLSFTRPQDCPSFTADLLGTTDASRRAGLIGDGFQAVSGDPSLPVSVQVHDSNIVCLRSGQTRDTYRGVSVVVNYTCAGAPSECTGTPTLSQFEFECVAGTWAASVDRSAANIITTPPSGSLSTTLRTDCGVCVSPARSIFAAITNNEQHCGCKYDI